MKIAILRDEVSLEGAADEQDNLAEADFAEKVLSESHIVKQIPFMSDISKIISELSVFKPDIVFNLVESVCGSGALSAIAAQLFEIMHIPYTGNKIYAQIISADKALAKKILIENGIPVPLSGFSHGEEYILKARTEHASIALDDGCIMKFHSEKEMENELKHRIKQTGFEWIAERYIEGREFNSAFIGDKILPPAEMCFDPDFSGHKILTYEAKWDEDALSYKQSSRSFDIEPEIKNRLEDMTGICKKRLMLEGYARVDYRMDKAGNLYVIDINTNPCISPDSGFVAMVQKAGISVYEMFDIILNCALKN